LQTHLGITVYHHSSAAGFAPANTSASGCWTPPLCLPFRYTRITASACCLIVLCWCRAAFCRSPFLVYCLHLPLHVSFAFCHLLVSANTVFNYAVWVSASCATAIAVHLPRFCLCRLPLCLCLACLPFLRSCCCCCWILPASRALGHLLPLCWNTAPRVTCAPYGRLPHAVQRRLRRTCRSGFVGCTQFCRLVSASRLRFACRSPACCRLLLYLHTATPACRSAAPLPGFHLLPAAVSACVLPAWIYLRSAVSFAAGLPACRVHCPFCLRVFLVIYHGYRRFLRVSARSLGFFSVPADRLRLRFRLPAGLLGLCRRLDCRAPLASTQLDLPDYLVPPAVRHIVLDSRLPPFRLRLPAVLRSAAPPAAGAATIPRLPLPHRLPAPRSACLTSF